MPNSNIIAAASGVALVDYGNLTNKLRQDLATMLVQRSLTHKSLPGYAASVTATVWCAVNASDVDPDSCKKAGSIKTKPNATDFDLVIDSNPSEREYSVKVQAGG